MQPSIFYLSMVLGARSGQSASSISGVDRYLLNLEVLSAIKIRFIECSGDSNQSLFVMIYSELSFVKVNTRACVWVSSENTFRAVAELLKWIVYSGFM